MIELFEREIVYSIRIGLNNLLIRCISISIVYNYNMLVNDPVNEFSNIILINDYIWIIYNTIRFT